jgi:2,3,4,5-tetrahydropyridine-2-carboxylate N-succinyltransferase
MLQSQLQEIIENSWEERELINSNTTGEIKDAVETTLKMLGDGDLRVAEKFKTTEWTVNQWAKKSSFTKFPFKKYGASKWWPSRGYLVG